MQLTVRLQIGIALRGELIIQQDIVEISFFCRTIYSAVGQNNPIVMPLNALYFASSKDVKLKIYAQLSIFAVCKMLGIEVFRFVIAIVSKHLSLIIDGSDSLNKKAMSIIQVIKRSYYYENGVSRDVFGIHACVWFWF